MDDLIITSGAYQLVADIKINLSQEFEMKDLGDLHYCLGIAFGENLVKHSSLKENMQGKYLIGFK